ncbi:SRPBCC family protein [Aureispira anguillae]|nr:SRPBCC domain-containing protein [Aureispira anguillae]
MPINSNKAVTTKTTFSRTTSIEINIQANKTIVWNLLTNVEDFSRWNSTIISLEGEIQEGKKIQLKSTTDPSRTFNLKVHTVQAEKSMIWSDGMAPFFKGVRKYQLMDNPDGSVTFSMQERLAGIFFALAAKHIPSFDAPFEQFAADLKQEAELLQQTKK